MACRFRCSTRRHITDWREPICFYTSPAARDEWHDADTPSGTWTQVLQGYTLNVLKAAPSNPAILYACAMPAQSSSSSSSVPGAPVQSNSGGQHFIVLHSTDFGAHWQAVGGAISFGYACQIAINPTNGNDEIGRANV